MIKRILANMLVAVATAAGCGVAAAQTYPDKPIRLIVPFSPGGPVDVLARAVAANLQVRLKQAVTVENKLGAAGSIGAMAVAGSPPDGYTLLVSKLTPPLSIQWSRSSQSTTRQKILILLSRLGACPWPSWFAMD